MRIQICSPAPSTCIPWSDLHCKELLLSFRCFVCRQSRQQLEEEQKKSLYGLESTGKVSGQPQGPPPGCQSSHVGVCLPSRPPFPLGLASGSNRRLPFARLLGREDAVETPMFAIFPESLSWCQPGTPGLECSRIGISSASAKGF